MTGNDGSASFWETHTVELTRNGVRTGYTLDDLQPGGRLSPEGHGGPDLLGLAGRALGLGGGGNVIIHPFEVIENGLQEVAFPKDDGVLRTPYPSISAENRAILSQRLEDRSHALFNAVVSDFSRHRNALSTGRTLGMAAPYAGLIVAAAMTPVGSALIIEAGLAAKDTAVISYNASVSVANAAVANAGYYYGAATVAAGTPAGQAWIQRGMDFISNWNPGEHGVYSPATPASATGFVVNQLTTPGP